ncbi:hypothetical protein ZIOFF_055726 [Zingiber officinale]|uniref:Uncharacterized protein n=1 Tax=Zingiber officinale TaxID=94328 RepID=A0A8J5KKK4_ZINOF|nr:hypothetical protein ZIOFF_055726 [Zingiber officinale]
MSRQWEEQIQEWYAKSHTSNLEYLDLAKTNKKPTQEELAHNLSVIYDRVCLSCRVHLRNFKQIQEEIEVLKEENHRIIKELATLTTLVVEQKQLKEAVVGSIEQNHTDKLAGELTKKLNRVEILLKRIEAGYEGWQNGEANILITRGMVGRLSNTPNVGFAYEVQNVVDYLTTHGVRALPGRRYSTHELQGRNWVINQSSINIPRLPTEVNTRNMIDGRISVQFENYQAASTTNLPHYNQKDEEIPSDEDEIQLQIIAVIIEEPEVLHVKRIRSTARLPERKTIGSTGYDLAIDREQFVPKRDRSLLTTGICV